MTHYVDPLLLQILAFSCWALSVCLIFWFLWDLIDNAFRTICDKAFWSNWFVRRYRLLADPVTSIYVIQYRRRIWPFWIDLKQTPYF